MMIKVPIFAPSAPELAYGILCQIGEAINTFSAQGLVLSRDVDGRWWWAWAETDLKGNQGYWAMGEALVDAAVTRFPKVFDVRQGR